MRNPLSILQAGTAFVRLAADMSRLDEVFNLGDGLVDAETLRDMVERAREPRDRRHGAARAAARASRISRRCARCRPARSAASMRS